jgi:tRNA pseudouridine65 synthase
MSTAIEIIYQDDNLLVVNKPHGLLMHRTKMAKDAKTSLLKILREQTGLHLHPPHRLDRKTAGVVLLALNKEMSSYLNQQFRDRKVLKTYNAIVRGYTEDSGTIDYPIKNEKEVIKEAVTHYKTLKRYECPWPSAKHNTSRYSLVSLRPETGRYHQLRMHMSHIFHPIIGDRPHGCNKQNRIWKELHEMTTMLLHAQKIEVSMPGLDKPMVFEADYAEDFKRVLRILEQKKWDIVQ